MTRLMSPILALTLLFGAIFGTLFHLWRGQHLRDLLIYVLAGIAGFILGQGIGNFFDAGFGLIGSLHVVEATIGSWLLILLFHWLKL